jgi:hypothetical protein
VPPNTSADAAGISAAYEMAVTLYPHSREQSVWDATRAETIAAISQGTGLKASAAIGQFVATSHWSSRVNPGD